MGTLFIVATPIGNLGDMTLRAIETLKSVSLIAAEDTRRTRQLLNHFSIEARLVSYHAFNERARRQELLDELTKGDVALVTDAGTPAIADPASDLVRAALEQGVTVSPIPGASALAAAASSCGLIDGPFMMLGFLPRSGRDRQSMLARAFAAQMPMVLFESPNRLVDTLRDLRDIFGDRLAAVMRELTKLHEEIAFGSLSELIERFGLEPVRGEIVIAVAGGTAEEIDGADAETVLRGLLATGMKTSTAAREASAMTGVARAELYGLAQRIKDETPTGR